MFVIGMLRMNNWDSFLLLAIVIMLIISITSAFNIRAPTVASATHAHDKKLLQQAQEDFSYIFSSVPSVNNLYFGQKIKKRTTVNNNNIVVVNTVNKDNKVNNVDNDNNFGTDLDDDDDDDDNEQQQFEFGLGSLSTSAGLSPAAIPSLGVWRTLSIQEDEGPPDLVSFLRDDAKFPPAQEKKVMEIWDEFQKKRCIRSFSHMDTYKMLFALKVAYAGLYEKKTAQCQDSCIERAKGTASVLGELKADANVVIAGILHDVFQHLPEEDIPVIRDLLKRRLGASYVSLVDKCNRLPKLVAAKAEYTPLQSEQHLLMLVATAEDYRALLVRIAERLHTMRELKQVNLESSEKIKIAQEALHVYAPLAHKMGVMKIKGELEDLAFRFIDPDMFKLSRYTQIAASKAFQDAADQIKEMLAADDFMKRHNATCKLSYRIKDKYQLFLKMSRKNLTSPNDVMDALGMRVIIDLAIDASESVEERTTRGNKVCYYLVSRLRAMEGWSPTMNGLKDYIAEPKVNGYQSIHQYIKNIALGTNVEVQVRTKEMHMTAELGHAAHWFYKDLMYRPEVSKTKGYKLAWRSPQQLNSQSPAELIGLAKQQLAQSRVFVFLEDKSTVLNLRMNSTALDAAFKIHSTLGLTVSSVKVQGRRTGLRHPLQNGDVITVEKAPEGIITAKPSWLNLVKSPESKQAMRKYFKNKERDATCVLGFLQLLKAIELNEDKIRHRFVQMPNAKGIIRLVAIRTPFHSMAELLLYLGTATKDAGNLVLSKLFDIPRDAFDMADISQSLSWGRAKSNKNWREAADTLQSKREMSIYLLEDLLIPLLYSSMPLSGFNPDSAKAAWCGLGMTLPLKFAYQNRLKISQAGLATTKKGRRIHPSFFTKFAGDGERNRQSQKSSTRRNPIMLHGTDLWVGPRGEDGTALAYSPYILEANRFVVDESRQMYIREHACK